MPCSFRQWLGEMGDTETSFFSQPFGASGIYRPMANHLKTKIARFGLPWTKAKIIPAQPSGRNGVDVPTSYI